MRALFIRTRSLLFAVAIAGVAFGQIRDFNVRGVTATQIVISYTAPDDGACGVDVSQSRDYFPPVHDVNPDLFSDSNIDQLRPSSITHGRDRVVVIGRRAAEEARDKKRYSRALQTDTEHSIQITCSGGAVQQTSVRTANIPIGMTYNDPLPADSKRAGEYAWPSIEWDNRNQWIIDPQTGLLLKRLTSSLDVFDRTEGTFRRVVDFDGTWRNASAILADDASTALFRGSDRSWLFLASNATFYDAGHHDRHPGSLDQFRVTLNAWCSGSSCNSAGHDDRSIEVCLTANGTSCATPVKELALLSCGGTCREARYMPVLGAGDRTMLGDWTESLQFDLSDATVRRGNVDRNGAEVVRKDGNPFALVWTRGSWIEIGGVAYRIERVVNQNRLILADSPEGDENGAAYQAANFGVLIRKKTDSPEEIAIQFARFEAIVGSSAPWDAGGDGDSQVQCSQVRINGPGGESGWNCNLGYALYWIGSESGNVSRIGTAALRPRPGVDGWSGHGFCETVAWDRKLPGTFYCIQPDNQGGEAVIRGTYSGSGADIGPTYLYTYVTECTQSLTTNCFRLENVTPASRGLTLRQQLTQFHPDWKNFKTPKIAMAGTMGLRNSLQLLARRDQASNDTLGYLAVFDLDQYRIVAAAPSWKSWPLRWTVLHGPRSISDPDWIAVPATGFRGPVAGRDSFAGNGPYLSTIVSGAVGVTGAQCPVRAPDSAIPFGEWPQGNRCLTVTVDGEPADPTPAMTTDGTLTSQGEDVTISGGSFTALNDKSQVLIANNWYTFQYVDSSHGRLSPAPVPPLRNAAFVMYDEPVNNPKTGNPLHAYLQDAEVGDIFCGSSDPSLYGGHIQGCSNLTFQSEFFRLIAKAGRQWTLERGFFGPNTAPQPFHPLPPNSFLVAAPASCAFQSPYSCASAAVLWNTRVDPFGRNQNNSLRADRFDQGNGHGFFALGISAASVSGICPNIQGDAYTCYNLRSAPTIPEIFGAENRVTSLNPAFAGALGLGRPNDVDGHPSMTQLQAPDEEKVWFTDARPLLGDSVNYLAQATNTGGFLWKFPAKAHPRLRPKILPTYAYCGVNPLVDVSGPLTRLTGSAEDSYRYCIAVADGECTDGSSAGEVFVNCPYVNTPSCVYPGIANTDADQRDICIGDLGAYTGGITQVAHDRAAMSGRFGRLVTKGLSRYRFLDVFWNVKTTPDGKWAMFRSAWLEGRRTEVLLAKLPPFPADDGFDRSNYVPIRLDIQPEGSSNVSGAVVEFGYDKEFRCTSRNEACVKGSEPGTAFSYASEPLKAKECASGCSIEMPIIPQRVYYFRVRYVDSDGKTVSRTDAAAWTSP